jgi:hypothetical protein
MTRRALFAIALLILTPVVRGVPLAPAAQSSANRLPVRLSGAEFFKLIAELSEPDGHFRSDNLVSNELYAQRVIPELTRLSRPGRAYLGVGPEQNFTYIAAVRPAMAFIIDVRRGNLHLHLMYKALFELSADRAEFVSRLFSRKRPSGLGRQSTVQQIMAASAEPWPRSPDLFKQNIGAIRRVLASKSERSVTESDLKGIEEVYQEFYTRGPEIRYEVTPGSPGSFPSYSEIVAATDDASVPRGFLATEENFALIKDLQSRNLIVPVVGDFAGPKAIRAVGKYLRARNAIVSAFYVSNVEQYLRRDGRLEAFCGSASTLPIDDRSTFIRSERGGFASRGGGVPTRGGRGGGFGFSSQLFNMLDEKNNCPR